MKLCCGVPAADKEVGLAAASSLEAPTLFGALSVEVTATCAVCGGGGGGGLLLLLLWLNPGNQTRDSGSAL